MGLGQTSLLLSSRAAFSNAFLLCAGPCWAGRTGWEGRQAWPEGKVGLGGRQEPSPADEVS